ncbi:SOS response-associated peptidase [Vibrio fluvialis]|uniref:SOS response-associated peptidase n=1 Tax=Vibrio fluvialis TaxID=676 RepID=UPI001F2BCB59|nr:SOS response-associated peptidase family protein [Vibrio fluvialis]MCE7659399.1 SOS response-associated peptidase [Vibrio fluvialis]
MCGRLNVIDDPLCRIVCERLGIKFSASTNKDLRPSEKVSTVIYEHGAFHQLDLQWGIKPDWSKKLIINAQSETAHIKPTFKLAFETSRVIIPCSGWYEWSEVAGDKRKFFFSACYNKPVYMAGLAFKDSNQLVTLTTKPTQQCAVYHNRMPLIIDETALEPWLMGTLDIINYVPPEQVQYQIHPEH